MMQELHVLLIGNDEKNGAEIINALAAQQFSLESKFINELSALSDALGSSRWDVGLYEWARSCISLKDVLRLIRESDSPFPVILVVDPVDESDAIESMVEEGVADCVLKGRYLRLGPAIRRELSVTKTRKRLEETEKKLDKKIADLERKERGARRAESALEREALRRQTLMNTSRDGIAMFDQQHRIVEANQRFAEMLGYTKEEMTSLYTWDFEAVMSEAEIRAGFADLTKTYQTFETRHRRKDGTFYDAEVSASGTLVGDEPMVFTISRDVTEKKKIQANLAQSDRLASMGMLAAGVAHEINNPLAYVLYHLQALSKEMPQLAENIRRHREDLQAQLMANTKGTTHSRLYDNITPLNFDKFNKRVREALEGTQRIQEIAGSLSTFSRVERQQLMPVDVHYTIECAANMAFNEIKYRARLVKDYGKISNVMASEGHLSQVFLNLLINAAHALDEGNVDENEIRVRTWQEDDVYVEVRDTGKGISSRNLDRIFDPFFTTKSIGEGSGLGLTISRNIIAGYGGDIDVTSKEGEGTSFIIKIPIRSAQNNQIAEAETALAESQTSGRILIIDDEVGILEALKDILTEHDVLTASSAKKGMALTKSHSDFDLVMCDLMMPDMSGMSFHKWLIKAYPILADRLVFITGGAFTPKARDYLLKVDNLCIHKPFDPDKLTQKVSELIIENRRKAS